MSDDTDTIKEEIELVSVPKSLVSDVKAYIQGFERSLPVPLPLYSSRVACGQPMPTDADIESHIDLHHYLIDAPKTTFFIIAEGDSMIGAGIHSGDMLVVDKAIPPKLGKIVVANLSGEMTIKRLDSRYGHYVLVSENEDFAPIVVTDEMNLTICGVVTNVIHPV